MTLDSLLTEAGIGNWDRREWFDGVIFDGKNLIVSNPDSANYIRKFYVPRFQEAGHTVCVILTPAKVAPRPSAFKKAYRSEAESRGWKPGGLL